MSAPTDPVTGQLTPKVAAGSDLDAATLYALLALRVDVFIVEQQAIDPELDHRDLAPGVTQVWYEAVPSPGAPAQGSPIAGTDRVVVAGARLVAAPAAAPGADAALGRVVVHPAWRGAGVGAAVVRRALACTEESVACKAQEHLVDWYTRFGFVPDGERFTWAGIPHLPLRLTR